MTEAILSVSDRGQVTIPLKVRQKYGVKHFICIVQGDGIVLKPLQTRDEFVKELEDAERDWSKNGGATLAQVKSKFKL
ncbi:MAG: AbrB/MazE/SpoVT family DNA-binding domain-containing protein [Candidatus Gracilibacteria bacterium]|jgi:bifunctional DNA-binding transcriptional regulator/antitoxin component of YhaV-PrlF toxin-antitoxin module